MIIEVTTEDIRDGARGSCRCCPVALALRRQVTLGNLPGDPGAVRVFPGLIVLGKFENALLTPFKAAQFINDFDAEREVEPFTFELEI